MMFVFYFLFELVVYLFRRINVWFFVIYVVNYMIGVRFGWSVLLSG